MRFIRHCLWHGVATVALEIMNMLRFILPCLALAFAGPCFASNGQSLPLPQDMLRAKPAACQDALPPDRGPQVDYAIRDAIALYRMAGGARAFSPVGSTTVLIRDYHYPLSKLIGLTEDELDLLHGWNVAWHQRRPEPRPPVYQPAVYQPTYAPRVWNAAPALAGTSSGCTGGG